MPPRFDLQWRDALRAGGLRGGFRILHYSVQGNHLHLLVEARPRRARSADGRLRIGRGRAAHLAVVGQLAQESRRPAGVLADDAGNWNASYTLPMTDAQFLAALEKGTYPRDEMDHRAHLRLALLFRGDPQSARDLLVRYITKIGGLVKYNETLTQVWLRLVSAHPSEKTLDALMRTPLADATLPFRHYSAGRLWSDEARTRFIEPDLLPLPQSHDRTGAATPPVP